MDAKHLTFTPAKPVTSSSEECCCTIMWIFLFHQFYLWTIIKWRFIAESLLYMEHLFALNKMVVLLPKSLFNSFWRLISQQNISIILTKFTKIHFLLFFSHIRVQIWVEDFRIKSNQLIHLCDTVLFRTRRQNNIGIGLNIFLFLSFLHFNGMK